VNEDIVAAQLDADTRRIARRLSHLLEQISIPEALEEEVRSVVHDANQLGVEAGERKATLHSGMTAAISFCAGVVVGATLIGVLLSGLGV
jgi:hypothetical protein